MSSSIRRIYINSYLAYRDDPAEGLQDFIAEIDETITDPDDINVSLMSLNFTPLHPNIPPYENTFDISYDGTRETFSVNSFAVYLGVVGSGSGTNLIDELNNGFKAAFSTAYEPFAYDADLVRIEFIPEAGKDYQIYSGTTTLARRVGLAAPQMDTVITGGTTLVASNPPIVSRTQTIFVATDLTTDSTSNANVNHGILMMLPVYNAEYGALINYQPSYDFGKLSNPRSFTNLRIRLLDDLFQPIIFNSNTNLLVALYIQYKDDDEGFTGQLKLPQ